MVAASFFLASAVVGLWLTAGPISALIGVAIAICVGVMSRVVRTPAESESDAHAARTMLERLNLAAQSAGIGIWDRNLLTGEFFGNDIFWAFADQPADTPPDEVIQRVVHPDDLQMLKEFIAHSLEHAGENEIVSLRFRIVRRGIVRTLQRHAQIFRNSEGKPIRTLGVLVDVTDEILRAENESRLVARFNVATRAAGIGSWQMELDPARIVWQDNFDPVLLTEGSEDPLPGVIARQHPDDKNEFRKAVAKAMKTGADVVSYRYRIRDAHGNWQHSQNYARLFFDAAGKPMRALGVTWFITDEVQKAERLESQAAQLRDAERRLERASRSSLEGHWEWDLTTEQVWHSAGFHALLGYPLGALPKTTREAASLLHSDDATRLDATLRERIVSGEPYTLDTRFRMAGGGYRWFRCRGMSELNAEGRPIRVAGSIQDIHDQKIAEDALKLVQRRFERAIHGTQDGLWEIEADLSSVWRSPRFAALLGFADEELPHTLPALQERVHPDDLPVLFEASRTHYASDALFDFELRMRTKSDEYRWYRARGVAERDPDGKPLRMSGSLQDVTDARQAREELLRATEAAHAANRAKSEFLANVSHEIRTPMNGILGMTGLLLDSPLDAEQRDQAATIRTSADSLLNVINDILDFSKIEAGKLDVHSTPFDLRDVVREVRDISVVQAQAKMLQLQVHIDDDVQPIVRGDPQRIRQCLLNLVGNAVKFTPSGSVTIAVSRAVGERIRFAVRDTGIGIAADSLKKLFQPFTQADSSTTRHFGGTGLGLSIVRRLMDLMSGEAGAHSEVGKGSTFWFELPLPATAEPVRHEYAAPSTAPRFRGRILLVEDNAVNQKVASQFLKRLGCDVDVANDGQEAVLAFKATRFDLVFMDLQMPVMDGYEATRRIRDFQGWRARTPIVALTANAMTGQYERCLAAGMDDFLSKPIQFASLCAILRKFVLQADSIDAREQTAENLGVETLLAGAESPPVDLGRLKTVGLGDDDFVRELIDIFVTSAAELSEELNRAMRSELRPELARAAHKLKGASANLHAHALYKLCAELETLAETSSREDLDARVDAVNDEVVRTTEYLRRAFPADGERSLQAIGN